MEAITSLQQLDIVVYHLQDGRYMPHAKYAGSWNIPVTVLPGFNLEWPEIFV